MLICMIRLLSLSQLSETISSGLWSFKEKVGCLLWGFSKTEVTLIYSEV